MATNAHHNLGINVTAEVADVERAIGRLQRSLGQMEDAMSGAIRDTDELAKQNALAEATAQKMGLGFIAAGGAILTGLGMATHAAMQWELQFADVIKTVGGTDAQLAQLEDQIRGLARTLPVAHDELARIAAIAGQLGIKSGQIAKFTKTVAGMAVATNLTAEEAAFALARFSTVMGIAIEDTDRLASTIVHLGNNMAVTEAEITQTALSAAGAAKVAGVAETDLLAMAAAMGAVGIKTEAGGTAISRFMLEVSTAVGTGSERLETFAEIAGVTALDFKQAYERDAGDAILTFLEGMGRMVESGEDVVGSLKELNLNEIRVRRALLGMASDTEVLGEAMSLANGEWDRNTALLEEVDRRYGTSAMQVQLLENNFKDAAMTIGAEFLPAVNAVVEHMTGWGKAFSEAEDSTKKLVPWVGLAGAGALILGGALIVLPPRIAATSAALKALQAKSVFTPAGMMGRASKFLMGPWGIAIAAATAGILAMVDAQAQADARTHDWRQALGEVQGVLEDMADEKFLELIDFESFSSDVIDAGLSLEEMREIVAMSPSSFQELRDAALEVESVLSENQKVTSGLGRDYRGTEGDAEALAEAQDILSEAGYNVAQMTDEQALALARNIIELGKSNKALKEAQDSEEDRQEVLEGTAKVMQDLEEAERDAEEAAKSRVEYLEQNTPQIFEYEQAQRNIIGALEELTEATEDAEGPATNLSEATDEQVDAFEDVVSSINDTIEAMVESGDATKEDIDQAILPHRDALIEAAEAAGFDAEQIGLLEDAIYNYDEALLVNDPQALLMTQHLKAMADQSDLTKEETDELTGSWFDGKKGMEDLKDAVAEGGVTMDGAERAAERLKDEFFEVTDQMGIERLAAHELWEMIKEGDGLKANVEIEVNAEGKWGAGGSFGGASSAPGFGGLAMGGPVPGDDPTNSDSILTRLTAGEFVLSRQDVRNFGGPTNIENFRRALRNPSTRARASSIAYNEDTDFLNDPFPGDSGIPGFAKGGLVSRTGKMDFRDLNKRMFFRDNKKFSGEKFNTPFDDIRRDAQKGVNDEMDQMTKELADDLAAQMWAGADMTWTDPSARLKRAAGFAKAQSGKPYRWGGVGPGGYDCSGYMSAIENVIRGSATHRRRYTTHLFRGAKGPGGWVKNLTSPFMIGNTHKGVGHMAGSLLGVPVEAAGGGKGVNYGGKARGANHPMFDAVYGFSPVQGEAKPGGGSGGVGGAARWSGVVQSVLRELGLPLRHVGNVLKAINKESGGNPRAINLWDSNARAGIPSKGLLQTIDPTFNAHAGKYRGLGPFNPRANIYAAIRYAKSRYGSGWAARMARPGGYDLGGMMMPGATGQNRTNMPERVLSPSQTAAFEELVDVIKGNGGVAGGSTTINQYGIPGFSDIREIRRAGEADARQRRIGGRT